MPTLQVGGTEGHIFNLISHLNKDKFIPSVYCLYDMGPMGRALVNNGFKVHDGFIRGKWDIYNSLKPVSAIKNENAHILYTTNYPLTQFWGGVYSRLAGIKINITRVATQNPIHRVRRRKLVNKIMLPFVDKVIAQSNLHKEYLINSEGFRPAQIEVIYNGIDADKFIENIDRSALRAELNVPEDVPVVGVVARLVPEKGYHTFLKAAKKITYSFPGVKFLIVGDGEERKGLEKIVERFSIQPNILFLGTRKDIPRMVSLFDVAVMPSDFDTFPNAILEYMAAGKPVVATNVGSASEIVVSGETGTLVAPGDHDALAGAILKLLENKVAAIKMGENGRNVLQEKFTVQKMVAKYEFLFEELSDHKKWNKT